MTTSVQVGLGIGLLLCFDLLAIFYSFAVLDWARERRATHIVLMAICLVILVNTTGIGFISSLNR